MLKSLYSDNGNTGNRVKTKDETEYGKYWALKTFEKSLTGRRALEMSYCSKLVFWIITSCCCCLKSCCYRVTWIRDGSLRYLKF